MSGCGLAIFVKTPALSPAKTRLWPALGRPHAEALYLHCAQAVASVAMQAQRGCAVQPYWAVAEADGLGADIWQSLPCLSQGEGGLGARMAHVYAELQQRHGAALLIGADAPQVHAAVLEHAATWLAGPAPRLVIGRAEDGGFWLFGGNTGLDGAAWERVAYSRADTAACFEAAFDGCGEWLHLPALRDLDTADDLAPVHAALAGLHSPTPEQRQVSGWLDAALAPAGAAQ